MDLMTDICTGGRVVGLDHTSDLAVMSATIGAGARADDLAPMVVDRTPPEAPRGLGSNSVLDLSGETGLSDPVSWLRPAILHPGYLGQTTRTLRVSREIKGTTTGHASLTQGRVSSGWTFDTASGGTSVERRSRFRFNVRDIVVGLPPISSRSRGPITAPQTAIKEAGNDSIVISMEHCPRA